MSREQSRVAYLRRRYRGSQAIVDRRERRIVGQYLQGLQQVETVLDLPSGVGRFTPQLRRIASQRLVCGDKWQETLNALERAELEQGGTKIETRAVDLYQSLPFIRGEFDLVFNFRFFHHIRSVEQREHVAAELARVAARYLIVSYYASATVHAWQKRVWNRAGHVRSLPMIPVSVFHNLFIKHEMSVIADRPILPLLHAHRIALLERQFASS